MRGSLTAKQVLIGLALLVPALAALSATCRQEPVPKIQYVDVTKASGLTFTHNSGAFGKKYLPEALGPGVALFDYNNDGWKDIRRALASAEHDGRFGFFE